MICLYRYTRRSEIVVKLIAMKVYGREQMVGVKKGSREHQQTPKSASDALAWRACGVIESSFETDHQAPSTNPSHPTLLTPDNSIPTTSAPLSHIDPSAKKHSSYPTTTTFTTAIMGLEATMIVYVKLVIQSTTYLS